MSPAEPAHPSGAGGFGGFPTHVVVLLAAGVLGLTVLAAACFLPVFAPGGLSGASSVEAEASRVALSSIDAAQRALGDLSSSPAERVERARTALGQGAGALSVLAASAPLRLGAGFWGALAVLLVGLLGLAWWLRRAWVGPLERVERMAWTYIHGGEAPILGEPAAGGRDARALSRLVQALVEHHDRRARHDQESWRAFRAALEHRMRDLGDGDLSTPMPEGEGDLRPLAQALEEARARLARRVERLHDEASAVAEGAETASRATRRMIVAHRDQRDALHRLLEASVVAEDDLDGAKRKLEEGLGGLRGFTRELQRSVHQHRAELSVAARRLTELRSLSENLGTAEERLKAVEECLALLEEFRRRAPESEGQSEGAKVLSTRAALALRRGREAIETLRQDFRRLQADTTQVAATLAEASKGAPAQVVELEPAVVRALQDSALRLLRTEDLLAEALRAVERSAAELADGAAELAEPQSRAREAVPRLARALAELRLDGQVEGVVLARLARLEADLAVAEEGGASAMGQAGAAALLEAAKASRARLGRLAAQTEAALEIVRGT